MMNNEMKNFIEDLIYIIQDKYNCSLYKGDNSNEDYEKGLSFAYFDILDIIESQIISFGYDINKFGKISPELGKKMEDK